MKTKYYIENLSTSVTLEISESIYQKNRFTRSRKVVHFRGQFQNLDTDSPFYTHYNMGRYTKKEIEELRKIYKKLGYSHAYVLKIGEATDLHKKITKQYENKRN